MSSLTRKIEKRKGAKPAEPSTAVKNAVNGMVTRKIHPVTGEMQDYHYTKGWR